MMVWAFHLAWAAFFSGTGECHKESTHTKRIGISLFPSYFDFLPGAGDGPGRGQRARRYGMAKSPKNAKMRAVCQALFFQGEGLGARWVDRDIDPVSTVGGIDVAGRCRGGLSEKGQRGEKKRALQKIMLLFVKKELFFLNKISFGESLSAMMRGPLCGE